MRKKCYYCENKRKSGVTDRLTLQTWDTFFELPRGTIKFICYKCTGQLCDHSELYGKDW